MPQTEHKYFKRDWNYVFTAFWDRIGNYFARKASPTFTGTPVAPTAAAGTNSTQIATTAFVQSAIGAANYAGSQSAGGPANKTVSIPFGEVDSTSTATAFTATVDGITELRDGVCVYLRNGVVDSASGYTININNLGAKHVYGTMTGAVTSTLFDSDKTFLFVYNSNRGDDGGWDAYYGYYSDTDTIGYQIRTNNQTLPMSNAVYRYRLIFTSADNTKFVPSNSSSKTNATEERAVCQTPINPFGAIFYYSSTTIVSANSRPSATALWQQRNVTLGYSFNRTNAALTLTSYKPVYLKCAPQSNGSAIMDSSQPIVQTLPTTDDGKIYIFLGNAYSATAIELMLNHPVYYYKNGAIRLWTGPV